MVSSNKLCLVLLTCVIFTAVSARLVFCGYISHSCTNNSTASRQSKQIENLLASLASYASHNSFRYVANSTTAGPSFGLFLCRGDVAGPACSSCVAAASEEAGRVCPAGREAVIWLDECMVRYSHQPIYAVLSLHPMKLSPGNTSESGRGDDAQLTLLVSSLASELALEAAGSEGRRFMVGSRNVSGSTEAVYGAVQCTPDLSPGDCSKCFGEAIKGIAGPRRKILLPSCYIMYDFNLFFDATALKLNQSPPPGKPAKKSSVLVATVASLAGIGFLSALAFIFLRRRAKKKYNALVPQDNCVNDMTTVESLQFDFRSIQIATNNFSDLNKLGRGGFGEVYKGILLDGREIAVKRLSKSSVQGEAEFKNEVMLVAKLQHRNLVRLFGFCLEGDEKLLVYEYVPNNSLDSILFVQSPDPKKQCRLNWSKRCNIVEGIARGVMYLHEDSRLKIIHRDLKASNILLDNNMNAKVSDFGMAKMLVGADQTQGNTKRIVGTYGYMAPEYAMEGLYSIKSDVYSFGVLLLEILSGRKNSSFCISDCATSLVAYAWQLWNEKKALDLIDICLKDSCHESELSRYINIGLLCVQEEALLRPTMSSVVLMLKSKAQSLSQPQRPAFIARTSNTTSHNEITAVHSCSVNGMTVSDFLPR